MIQDDGFRIRRRGFLRFATVSGLTAAVASATGSGAALADTEAKDAKRRARYQPNAPQVQTFYRVNRYPTKG